MVQPSGAFVLLSTRYKKIVHLVKYAQVLTHRVRRQLAAQHTEWQSLRQRALFCSAFLQTWKRRYEMYWINPTTVKVFPYPPMVKGGSKGPPPKSQLFTD